MAEKYLSGFISVMGSPNAGKSTVVNAIVGEKVSIVSPKPQTTRNTVRGVLTTAGYQMVFLDTPGIIVPKNRLNERMMGMVSEASRDVDAIVFVIDAAAGYRERDQQSVQRLIASGIPLLAAINKTDAVSAKVVAEIESALAAQGFSGKIIPVCALSGEGLTAVVRALIPLLPEGPQYFPEDMYTDSSIQFMAGELIREQALLCLSDEVPHGVGVEIEKCELRPDKPIYDISAVIYCERRGHKNIIVGSGGSMIKRIGSAARPQIEELFGCKVFLQLFVKVREDWRNSPSILKTLGYE